MPTTATVTFLLTDVEGSTRLWEGDPEAMSHALARHDELVGGAVARHAGELVKPRGEGDSTFSVFVSAADAVAAAVDLQLALAREPWLPSAVLKVRAGLHTGEAYERHGDWYGPAPNRAARIRGLGHGGQTILSSTTAALVRDALPGGCALTDLGSHRLAGITGSERVWQLDHPDLPRDFPPLRSPDVSALPARLTSFVGPESRIASVAAALERSRLVTLTGPGGIGKTRLAVEVSVRTPDRYPGGVWMVDLSALTDPALVWAAVASATHTPEGAGTTLSEAVTARLGDEPSFVVLDNCEHVLDAATDVAAQLLDGARGVHLLATSRQDLGIAGETVIEVQPLGLPSDADPTASDAYRLFVDRARLVDPEFDPDGRTQAIADIVARLDGVPLAIELAASRVRVLSAEEIDARLADRFRLLVGPRTAPARTRSLRAAVDWSYDLLDEPDRRLFARLSVFASPFTLEWAERVCGDDDVLDGVARLVERSLVHADRSGPVTRFRMLETLRAYASEKLRDSGDADETRDRHLAWCAGEARAAATAIEVRDLATAFDALEPIQDEIRSALDHADSAGAARTGLVLSTHVHRFWLARGHWTEARTWLERFRDATDAAPEERGRGLVALSAVAQAQGDHEAAREAAALAAAAFGEDRAGLAAAALREAQIDRASGRADRAEEGFARALELARAAGAAASEADALEGLASVARMRGDDDRARELYTEALGALEARGLPPGGGLLFGLAATEHARGRHAEARALYERCLDLARSLGERRLESAAVEGVGRLHEAAGELDEALASFREALAIDRELGDPVGVAAAQYVIGNVLRRLGRAAEARSALDEALSLSAPRGVAPIAAATMLERGWLELDAGRESDAREVLIEAVSTFAAISHAAGVVAALEGLAATHLVDDPRLAAYLYGHADAERRRLGMPLAPSETGDHLARVDRVRTALGDGFAQPWDEGASTPTQDVLAALRP
ncbi:MAG TPA: tetratricopeptide repeat protein [Actinomycetota bacterium]|nr:tetratricopeptide repeat protein [Actinomycetota bacterium]